MSFTSLKTSLGTLKGIEKENSYAFFGMPYGKANRFEYAEEVTSWGDIDATEHGDACIQKRCYYEHLEIPERAFYHKEYREGIEFKYSEDCLRFDVYTPKKAKKCPVIVFIHGGGFDSGANSESAFSGDALASRGIVTVFIQYRVGVFGYFTHQMISEKYGHEGNFGLSDQILALSFIKKHIEEFGGDKDNITVMGQSAGAMSIQCLLYSDKCAGLFQKAVMISGAGLFPKLASPKPVEERREYWLDLMNECGAKSFEEFQVMDPKPIFDALEIVKKRRKDNQISTMTMVDHYYLPDSMDKLMKKRCDIPTIVSFTNNDMYTALLAYITTKYSSKNKAYCYYFDVNQKGDNNLAFHSSDLRYLFGTLADSWRPYDETDYKISALMMDYLANFAKRGDPNGDNLPLWKKEKGKALIISPEGVKMGRPGKLTLLKNTFLGDPK